MLWSSFLRKVRRALTSASVLMVNLACLSVLSIPEKKLKKPAEKMPIKAIRMRISVRV
jgi:hypothetical protein